MNQSKEFYLNKLYPLQDKVIDVLSLVGTPFYLTGGTVISRIFCKHRFSDDLDFFVNHDEKFEDYVRLIVTRFKEKFTVEDIVTYDTLARLFISENEVKLKVEFINDVKYRVGDSSINKEFGRIDTWNNILVNKLTATARNAAKDYSDLLFLSYQYQFNWKDIIEQMNNKDAWLDEIKVAENVDRFVITKFDEVNWIIQPDFNELGNDLIIIAKDILLGNDNSLYKD